MRTRLSPAARLAAAGVPALAALATALPAHAGTDPWTGTAAPAAATVTGGPWTLQQSQATFAQPLGQPGSANRFCPTDGAAPQDHLPSGASDLMQPYYFPFVRASASGGLDGWFDWRPKDADEALVHATSADGGVTWSADPKALHYRSTCSSASSTSTAPATADDNGQGHPFVTTVAGKRYLYTLDRQAGSVDSLGLLVHDITGGAPSLPAEEPLSGTTTPGGAQRTSGLVNPDGVLAEVPGAPTTTVLYISKTPGYYAVSGQTAGACPSASVDSRTGKKANQDKVEVREATTTDGISWTDRGVVSGLNDPATTSTTATRFIGPNGTIITNPDGSLGLFFSGGNCVDGDSDAYHYIGYAHASEADPTTWVVDNGFTNPVSTPQGPLSVDYSYPQAAADPATGALASSRGYYTGRVYNPQVVPTAGGGATLLFSGYQYPSPTKNAFSSTATGDRLEYRTILRVPLTTSLVPTQGVPEAPLAVGLPLAGVVAAGGALAVRRRRTARA